MENPFLRDLGCFARHLRPYLDRFPAKNILVVQFDAIRRAPDACARASTDSSTSTRFQTATSKQAKTRPALRVFPSSNPAHNESTKESPRYRVWANS